MKAGESTHKGFSLEAERLMFKGRVVLSNSSALIPIILKEYHSSSVGGHLGEVKSYPRIAGEWFWYGLRKAVTNFVREYTVCRHTV